jgi:hypothetical protein
LFMLMEFIYLIKQLQGSIKYVHQECLQDWLRHSGSTRCELCHHAYKFTPIYAPDAPRIDVKLVMEGVLQFVATQSRQLLRYALLLLCWCVILPYLTTNMWAIFVPWPGQGAGAGAGGLGTAQLSNGTGSLMDPLLSATDMAGVEGASPLPWSLQQQLESLNSTNVSFTLVAELSYGLLQRLFIIPTTPRHLLEMLLHGLGLCLLMFVVHASFFSVLDYLQSYQEQERLLRRAMRQQQQQQQQQAPPPPHNVPHDEPAPNQNNARVIVADDDDTDDDIGQDNNNNDEDAVGDGDGAGQEAAQPQMDQEQEQDDEQQPQQEREMDLEEFLGLKGPIIMIVADMFAVSVYIFCALVLLVGIPDLVGRLVVWGAQRAYPTVAAWNLVLWPPTAVSALLTRRLGGDVVLFGHPLLATLGASSERFWNAAIDTVTRLAPQLVALVSEQGIRLHALLDAIPSAVWGYGVLLVASLIVYRRRSYRVLVKVILLFVLELVLMPIALGWVVQWSTEGVLGGGVVAAPASAPADVPATELNMFTVAAGLMVGTPYETGARLIARWLLGFVVMLLWARVLRAVRDTVKPGLLWFIRFNDDADWSMFRSFVQDPVKLHLRRTLETFAFHAAAVLAFLFLPIWSLRTISAAPFWLEWLGGVPLLPVSVAAVQNYRTPADFALLHVALPFSLDLVRARYSARVVLSQFLRLCSRLLGIEAHIMPTAADPPLARPRGFVFRTAALIAVGLLVLFGTVAGIGMSSLLLGRWMVRDVLGMGLAPPPPPQEPAGSTNADYVDVYHFIVGLYLVILGIKILSQLIAAVAPIFIRTHPVSGTVRLLWRRALRALPVVVLGLILVPLLTGILVDWTLFQPHQLVMARLEEAQHQQKHALARTSVNGTDLTTITNDTTTTSSSSHVDTDAEGRNASASSPSLPGGGGDGGVSTTTPLFTMAWLGSSYVQAWFFGVVLLKLLYRILTSEGVLSERMRRHLQDVVERGVGDAMNLPQVLGGVVVPMLAIQAVLLAVPSLAMRGFLWILGEFVLGVGAGMGVSDGVVAAADMRTILISRWPVISNYLYLFSHLLFLLVSVMIGTLGWLIVSAIQAYRRLRDERYVVGHRLHNRNAAEVEQGQGEQQQ